MKTKFFLLFLVLFCNTFYGQNIRDKFIFDSIQPYINNIKLSKTEYYSLKKALLTLDEKYGYDADYHYRLLNKSYANNDIDFFKVQLSILVEFYGFNLAYMNESESYFNAIIKDFLRDWFKKMYLKNHFIWLDKNFDKQIDQRVLNEIGTKDQLVNNYSSEIYRINKLDSIEKGKIFQVLRNFFKENILNFHTIVKKNGVFPTAHSFALIQNDFGVAFTHIYQSKNDYKNVFELFYPFYKKAYLNNEITYMNFRNYDNFSFLHNGVQKFGLIKIQNIPLEFKKNNDEIPIENIDFMIEAKKEFKWY